MSLKPMRQVRTTDKNLMDVQQNAAQTIHELQAQGVAESRLITITLPTQTGLDINLSHNFGRPMLGALIVLPPSTLPNGAVLSLSPTASPQPNVFGIVCANVASPTAGPAISLLVLVF